MTNEARGDGTVGMKEARRERRRDYRRKDPYAGRLFDREESRKSLIGR
jgi:hypothetical protein